MPRLCRVLAAALTCSLLALPAAAQDAPLPSAAPPPANLAFVDGGVDLIHDGAAERAENGVMLLDGDVIRTANGRAEIVFTDGTVLHLDHDTEIELLSPLRLRLSTGRLLLRVSAAATTPYAVDTQAASVRLSPRGEYDLTADRRSERLELAVARGTADIDDGGAATPVRSGEMASILGAGGRVLRQTFNSARFDAFERWSSDRVNGFASARSAQWLPSELRAYGGYFDSYGRWDYVAPYGNVWFPSVGVSWRPYYSGSWRMTRYGWTWIGVDPWAWPTHHFGRWGFTGASWYWIPHRAWGPAWVSWAFVPGYVSWSPLGWDNRAVLPWHRRSDHPAYWPNYDPYRAWTVVPRDSFGNRRPVRGHAIDPARLPDATRRAMADVAVPRGAAGVAPGAVVAPSNNVAVPRGLPPATGDAERRYRAGDWTDLTRRGRVRAPASAPQPAPPSAPASRGLRSTPPPASTAPTATAPEAVTPPAGAVERRQPPRREWNNDSQGTSQPRVHTPRAESPRTSDDGAARRDPGRANRPQASERPAGDRGGQAERSDSGRRGPSGAVPRAGRESSQGSSSQRGGGASAGSGGARRRPPQ